MDKIISVCAYRQAQIVGIFRARWLILKSNHIRGDLLVISIIMIREHANAGMPSRKYPLYSLQLYTENNPPLCLQGRIISVWLRSRYTNSSFQNCRSVHSVDISIAAKVCHKRVLARLNFHDVFEYCGSVKSVQNTIPSWKQFLISLSLLYPQIPPAYFTPVTFAST